jgi:hypothetical protein
MLTLSAKPAWATVPFTGTMEPHDHGTEYVIVRDGQGSPHGEWLDCIAQGPLRVADLAYGYDVLTMDPNGTHWAENRARLEAAPVCTCGRPYYHGGRCCHPDA